jgi:thioredoxin reductase
MINHEAEVAIIGGGPAGLAAAVSAKEQGAEQIIVLDRNSWLGGILPQCIHDGFGVEETGYSMTGPEYASKYIEIAEKQKIQLMKKTMVLDINKKREILAVNTKGLHRIKAKTLMLATGCREKTRWNTMIPGSRPSGIYTAGVAQAFINLYNIMPGQNVIILGSGDVGLIMARRLKFEGANVIGVVEILPYATGLPRNVVQCLDDYDIPLYLNHTVTSIEGKERLEAVEIAQIDEHLVPLPETKKRIACDTLLLSLGLIPEIELVQQIGVAIDNNTGGPIVTQDLETTLSGVFACGNCLQVYDTVDLLTEDAKQAGNNAAKYCFSKIGEQSCISRNDKKFIPVIPGRGIRYVVPQHITKSGRTKMTLRAVKPGASSLLQVVAQEKILIQKKLRWVNPANMIRIAFDIPSEIIANKLKLEVLLDEK